MHCKHKILFIKISNENYVNIQYCISYNALLWVYGCCNLQIALMAFFKQKKVSKDNFNSLKPLEKFGHFFSEGRDMGVWVGGQR